MSATFFSFSFFIKCTKKEDLKYTKLLLLKPVMLTDNHLQGNIICKYSVHSTNINVFKIHLTIEMVISCS